MSRIRPASWLAVRRQVFRLRRLMARRLRVALSKGVSCQPCMSEIPDLKQLAANSKAKVIGIALDQDGIKTIRPFVANNNINYTVLVGDEEVFQRFNGIGIPYTLVLDSSQRIVKIYRGPTTKEALEQDLKTIVQGTELGSMRQSGSQSAN
jgi:Redoxin